MTEKPKRPKKLDKAEARQILEELARTKPPSAQVAAIRVLLRLERQDEEEEAKQAIPPGFEQVYAVKATGPPTRKTA